jgi:diguanylate cyclase (GGDEF)-like protein
MPAAAIPATESERLAALQAYGVLDTCCERAFDEIAELAAHVSGCPMALISLVDAERQWFKARVGLDVAETPREMAFCAHAILHPDSPLAVPDATRDPRFRDNGLVTGAPHLRAYLGVPLVTPEGQALGTLCVLDRVPRDFCEGTIGAMSRLARTVVTTLELRRVTMQAQSLALTDSLTGLPNRAAFMQELGRAILRQRSHEEGFALLYLDLDGFKRVNDVLGHGAGDLALQEAGAALRGALRRGDLAARLGGDEFGIVLPCEARTNVPGIADRLRRAVRDRMDSHAWPVTASIGAVQFMTAPEDEEEAVTCADELVYAAKRTGKDRVVFREYFGNEPG